MGRAGILLLLLLALGVRSLTAQAEATGGAKVPIPKDDGRRGVIRLQFPASHPNSDIRRIAHRMGWTMSFIRKNDPVAKHAIKECSYVAYVPKSYDAKNPAGIMVWVPVGVEGGFPSEWIKVLEKRNLIGISANRSGNDRLIWYRVALAIDAAFNLKKSYSIDDERVYVAGYSGGGRVASRVAMHYPGIFHGGIYNGGCNYFKRIPRPAADRAYWPKRFPRPRGRATGLVRTRSRHVFVCGATDPNRAQSLGIYRDMKRNERFNNVAWIEIPAVGHVYPDNHWFAKTLDALEAPLLEARAKKQRAAAKRDLRRRLIKLGQPEREAARAAAKKKRDAKILEQKQKAVIERAKKRAAEKSKLK
ncbi:MAG: hypothetical protein V3W41_02810 [Planctomycetota bacterium]